MTRLASMKRVFALSFAAILSLAMISCASSGNPAETHEPVDEVDEPIVIEMVPPTPSPLLTPTPMPEMTIDEDGDITLRSDILAGFSSASFSFDHKPTVLIYHTHAAESYLKTKADTYTESETGRTLDARYNVIAVGNALAKALEARGFTVIHDKTNVEGDDLTSAYSRSLTIMHQYDNVDLYIDLHRNSSLQREQSDNTIQIDGKSVAKLFFVVGTGIGTYTGEYDTAPDWKNNYTFAYSLTQAISAQRADLIKPIRLKVGRYNQHMGLCLLAEVGTNADTLQAVLNTVPYLANAIATVCPIETK